MRIAGRGSGAWAAAIAALLAVAPAARPAGPGGALRPRLVDLDRSGTGYPVYRIPALAVTGAGTLIAAYDARPSMADLPSHIAVVVRRSHDGGASWGERRVVRADTAPYGFGDPSLLVDRSTGRVWLFYAASARRGFAGSATGNAAADPDILQADVSWSDDDGATWRSRRLTPEIKNPVWGGMFAASGAGIELARGPHAGRLVQQYVVRFAGRNYGASLYSDDHGASWRFGALVGPGVDENKTVERADGTVLLNARSRPFRLVARSTDGGASYTGLRADSQLVDPGNNAGIVRYDPAAPAASPRSGWIVFSNTADSTRRDDLTVRLSCDGGRTWPVRRVLVPGPAGYSTLAVLPGGDIGILFERGDYAAISFARLPLRWLGGGCPRPGS